MHAVGAPTAAAMGAHAIAVLTVVGSAAPERRVVAVGRTPWEHGGVSGNISPVIASLVLDGLRKVAPQALADRAAVETVTSARGDGVPLGPYRRISERPPSMS